MRRSRHTHSPPFPTHSALRSSWRRPSTCLRPRFSISLSSPPLPSLPCIRLSHPAHLHRPHAPTIHTHSMTSTRPRRRRPTPATLIFRAIGMASALVGLSCRVNSTIITRTGRRAAPAFLLPLHSLHSTQPFTTSSTSLHGRGGGGGKGDDKLSKGKKKGDLPEKTCVVCGRPFTWRAKWAKVCCWAYLLYNETGGGWHIFSMQGVWVRVGGRS